MDKVQVAITLMSSIVVSIGAITGFIISVIKAIKSNKVMLSKKDVVLGFWMEISNDTESMAFMNIEEREKFIKDKFADYAKANDINFSAAEFAEAIKGIIEFSKKIQTHS